MLKNLIRLKKNKSKVVKMAKIIINKIIFNLARVNYLPLLSL